MLIPLSIIVINHLLFLIVWFSLRRHVFGFLHYLVLKGVFDNIYVSFLPVGHTHEDIDQMFSRFAVYLKGNNVYDMDELFTALKTSFTPSPEFIHLTKMTTIKDFFSCASGNQEEIVGLFKSGIRFFKIFGTTRAPGNFVTVFHFYFNLKLLKRSISYNLPAFNVDLLSS